MAPVHFSKHKLKTSAQTLLVTIRSGSIAFMLVQYGSGEQVKPLLLFEKVAQLDIKPGSTAPDFICKTESVLEKELEQFIVDAAKYFAEQELGEVKIQDTSVVYTAPWYSVITQDIVIQKEEPFELTEKKFDAIVTEQVTKHKKNNADLVEQYITHVILNGYELTNPFKKKANELTISLYVSFLEQSCKKNVKQIIKKTTGTKLIHFGTQPLVSFLTLRDLLQMHHSYAHVHITSENTEIYIIKQGSVAYIAQIPFGKKSIVDMYVKKTKYSREVALSKIKQYKKEDSDTDSVVASIEKEWVKSFAHVLQDATIQLPNYLYITGGAEVQDLVTMFMQGEKLAKKIYSNDARIVVTPFKRSQFTPHFEWHNKEQQVTTIDVLLHVHFMKIKHAL